jgi:hypothetical protein
VQDLKSCSDCSVKFLGVRNGSVIWESLPGAQTDLMVSRANEILLLGERGSGKTDAIMAWMVVGNRSLAPDNRCYSSILNHPKFSGLVLLEDIWAAKAFADRAGEFYGKFGGKKVSDPPIFSWSNGPRIFIDSFSNIDRYRGYLFSRIAIDEVLPNASRHSYCRLLSSCRPPDVDLMPRPDTWFGQVLIASRERAVRNTWAEKRFLGMETEDGRPIFGRKIVGRDSLTGLYRQGFRLGENKYVNPDVQRTLAILEDQIESETI